MALQGFGNVGSHAAKFLYESEYKIVAVGDQTGGYYRESGLDVPAMLKYALDNKGLLQGYARSRADQRTKSCWNSMSICSFPRRSAASSPEKNAAAIRAPVIIEAANAPDRSRRR